MQIFDYILQTWELAVQGEKQGIWFWAAVYVFLVCNYSALFQLLIRRWPSTKGELLHIGLDKFGAAIILADQDYRAAALYSYQIEGKTYQGKRISPWVIVASHNAQFVLKKQLSKVETFPNGKVSIFYKPSNPAKSWLILPSKFGISITLLISVLPAFSYWVEYYG
ncbi:hypothetical protein [Paraglaciecola arctica]|uniref:DUF3592 domain-containing protein n=1 Tax=Paraglaciecola arctica BSs20135 TaxID=493475 RepID=K6YRK3_9ALTE|nr:hypothetical protein [Paraglaciecola arctica]GAC20782.1 hypothetical protein GARC_3828 [Paraglaciecola arctica BSs20135]